MLTGVLHTRNRPEFLERALRYYSGKFRHPILVLDGSDELHLAATKRILEKLHLSFHLEFVHHEPSTPFYQRLSDGLSRIKTPYLMLMADDDFYFESWPQIAIDYLEQDRSCGVVYGHTLHFEIDGYVPYGSATRFAFSVPNPVARWMEDPSAVDRLRELGRGPWTTMGWYAVQRVEIFRRFISTALAANFNTDMGERLLNIIQPICGKLAMLDTIYLARQSDSKLNRKPSAFDPGAISQLERLMTEALEDICPGDSNAALQVVRECMRPEIHQLKSDARRAQFRIDSIKNVPLVRQAALAAKALFAQYRGVGAVDRLAPDPRFPQRPSLHAARDEIRLVKEFCASRS